MRVVLTLANRFVSALGVASLFGVAALQAATLGTTTVNLNQSTVGALVGAGITPGAVAPGTLTGYTAMFPITSVSTDGTMIDHSGGLSFTKGTTTVDIENFVINTSTGVLSGDVYSGSTRLASGVNFFDIGSGDSLTLDPSLASAVNQTFQTTIASGTPIGTASISLANSGGTGGSVTPEPSSLGLLGIGGLGALIFASRSRRVRA